MLNSYWQRRCWGYDFEFEKLAPPEIRPAFYENLELPPVQAVSLEALRRGDTDATTRLCNMLKVGGWAPVTVTEQHREIADSMYASLRHVFTDLSPDSKKNWRVRFDGQRYVGHGSDLGREWLQMRQGFDDPKRLEWPGDAGIHRFNFGAAFETSDDVARVVVQVLLSHASHPDAHRVPELLDDTVSAFGASVMRAFIYKDKHASAAMESSASGLHADMGLLTVCPPSSVAAFEIICPRTGAVSRPEQQLKPNEWMVFAGETLAFMTGGCFRAPIHRVPWINREDGTPPRVAAPFFLRAAADATLVACDTGEKMRCATFMKSHAVGMRPWRLKNKNGRNDW